MHSEKTQTNRRLNCLILARGGSKGVPSKNIRVVGGKPLLAYPIEAAKRSNTIDRIFVSTDSEAIKDVAEHYGATVINRPADISGDTSLDVEAFRHFVETTGLTEPLVHLRATTPLIEPVMLDMAVTKFFKHEDYCTSLRSAHVLSETAFKMFATSGEFWKGLFPDLAETDPEYFNKPRQFYPDTYAPNGYVDIVKPSVFMGNTNSFHGANILSFITPRVIEVDTLEDLEQLEFELQRRAKHSIPKAE